MLPAEAFPEPTQVDSKARGLLDTTLVHWGGEIGRLPVTENHGAPEKAGRDHNGQGFSTWLAGGGVKGGTIHGGASPHPMIVPSEQRIQ